MNNRNINTGKFILPLLCFLLLILLVLINVLALTSDKESYGKIIFRLPSTSGQAWRYRLIIADGNLNRMHTVSDSTGSPALSKDGNYIATGCQDPTDLCIYDVSDFDNYNMYPVASPNTAILHREIELPSVCQSEIEQERFPEAESISWSPEGDQLIVVCEVKLGKHEVCSLFISSGIFQCWDDSKIDGDIISAAWSPVEDRIAITVINDTPYPKIYLADPDGGKNEYLIEGWSPDWSSDGNRISFFRWDEDVRFDNTGVLLPPVEGRYIYGGIAIIDKDGENSEWIYRYPQYGSDDRYLSIWPFCERFYCKLTWSPDDRYIAFDSSLGGGHVYYIFRIDLKTKDIRILSSNLFHYYSNPDWGP